MGSWKPYKIRPRDSESLSQRKGGYMNSITDLLDLEDTDIFISDIQI